MYFLQVGQEMRGGRVTKGNKNDTVVAQRREGGVDSHFLSSTGGTSRNEDASVLASEATIQPETTGGIPEGLS